jgi:hypothetical protein
MRSRVPAALASAVGGRGEIVIRRARPTDGVALRRLEQLADRVLATGDVLIAEADGTIVAAAPVDGGIAVADPFVVSGDVIELLALRARQLAAAA